MLKIVLDYILVEERIHCFFNYFGWIVPLLCIIWSFVLGVIKHNLKKYIIYGMLWGLTGPGIWVMWKIYISLIDYYGIDSVKGLLVIMGVFVATGAIVGLCIRIVRSRLFPV